MRTFSHRKTCVTNQNISIWYKHSFQKAILSCGKKFEIWNFCNCLVPENQKIWLGTPLPKLRRKTTKLQGKSVYTILFVGEIFPPYRTHWPGDDPFEAVMCYSRGCLSNLIFAYRSQLSLQIQNVTWNFYRIIQEKVKIIIYLMSWHLTFDDTK